MFRPEHEPAASLVEAARALAPLVAASADEIERQRRLPESLAHELAQAGLFRMLVPRRLGGGEADLRTFALAIEEIAKADGSTAWCISQAAASARIIPRLLPTTAAAIFGNPRGIVAWGDARSGGSAVPVDGGYRLTGRWSFASGSHHATWLGGYATPLHPDGRPVITTSGAPAIWVLLFPADRAEFTDVWQVSGLRGTGSDSYAVSDLFVPQTLAVDLTAPEPAHGFGPLTALPQVSFYATGFASVALGIARGALDALVELAATKTRRGAKSVLRDSAVMQFQLGQAEATLLAAHSFLHTAIAGAWASACASGTLSMRERVLIRLAATHAIQTSADVTNTVYRAAGASAIFTSNPFERRFRDVHAVTQQVQGSQAHYETAGRFFLGADGDLSWV